MKNFLLSLYKQYLGFAALISINESSLRVNLILKLVPHPRVPAKVCRWIPWTINNYKLDELTNAQEFRSNLSLMFKQNAHIKNPRVVDILIYKGREELEVNPTRSFP